jgi:ECF sigma factor
VRPGEQDGTVPRPVTASSHDVTALLQAWTGGDVAARDQLMAVVYRELRVGAALQLRRERRGHSLQPTALVHEAYMPLVDQRRMVSQNRRSSSGWRAR